MAQSYLNISVNAETAMTAAPTGKYSLFLNSTHSDTLYKIDDAGVVTSAVNGLIDPMTTVGDMIIRDALNVTERLGVGSAGQVLTVSGGLPSWQTPSGGTVTSVSGTTNRVTSTGGSTPIIDIDVNYVGQSSITTLGTIGAGVWQGTVIGKVYGGTGVNIATTALTLGTASSAAGSIVLQNATNANTLTIQSGATSASYSLTLPTAQGGANTYLKNDGAGTLSWATVASGISIGDAIGNSPVTGSALMAIGGVITQSISYRAQQATPYGTYFGFQCANSTPSGIENSAYGYQSMFTGSTGTNNTSFGFYSLYYNATGSNNTAIGSRALVGSVGVSVTSNTAIGSYAMNTSSASFCTAIGAEALKVVTGQENTSTGCQSGLLVSSGASNSFLGFGAGSDITTGSYNIGIGRYALYGKSTTSYSIHIGSQITPSAASSNYNTTISIGHNAFTTAANQGVLGSSHANGYISDWHFNGVTHTAPYSVTLHACHGSGTNVAGANITLDAGNATGTGASGNFKVTSSVKGSSGTTLQTSGDRVAVIGKYVDLTAATATAFCRINIPTSTTSGGFIIATVEANDGVDYQARTFYVSWAAANKAGTTTVGLDVAHEIVAATSGTLTGTMTLVDSGSGNIDFKMDASSSLVETTLRISFQVFKNLGTGAVSAS